MEGLGDRRRRRSDGVLSREEIAHCRARGIALAFDPVQQGMVPLECDDDITPNYAAERDLGVFRTGIKTPGMHQTRRSRSELNYTFRSWENGDAAVFVALLGNANVWIYLPDAKPDPLSEQVARDLIEISNHGSHHVVRAIELDGVAVGQVRLLFDVASQDNTEAEISYWIGQDYWGRGIATDAVSRFTETCFQDWPELKSIWARVHEGNAGSIRVLERSGYQFDRAMADQPMWQVYRTLRPMS